MNRKINTLCFIFSLLFLISAASAADCENETLKTISANDINNANLEEPLQASNAEICNLEPNTVVSAAKTDKQKVALSAPNVNMYYKDGHKFTVSLKDKNKNAIRNAKVKISIAGTTYNQVTDKQGTATINLNFKSGSYSVITTFDGTRLHEKASAKSTVTIKSTIKSNNLTKFYKNAAALSAAFYDKNGKILKNAPVTFKMNGKTYYLKTGTNGVAKQNINYKPGKYKVAIINPKTGEAVFRYITVKSLIETKDLTMNYGDTASFNVKILDCYGKASPNKKATLKVNGKTYTKKTDKYGKINLPIDLEVGKYTITTEYDGLKVSNKIVVNKVIKKSSFKHITLIPNYVNITLPYVYPNAKYSLRTGVNGTVKMPKIEIFTVEIGSETWQFATGKTGNGDIVILDEKSYLVPFNGLSMVCSSNKNSLFDNGIMITKKSDHTEIEYLGKTNDNVEMFGFYANRGSANSEILTYMQNDKIMAKVSIQTQYFDETGVKYSLAKFYKRANADFAYYEITNHVQNPIIFTNTGKPVTYSYFGNNIAGYISKEEITTRFIINGKEELEKMERISYGLDERYRRSLGFEVLQTYSIIAERITEKTLEDWISLNPKYLDRFGVMNLYGMHLASIETVWLADELADKYAKEFNVTWKRGNAIAILGGINLDDTYLNILNADMGMLVKGNKNNAVLFRLMNSMILPNIEEYVLTPVSERYMDNATNSLESILSSFNQKEFSMLQLGDLLYIFSRDDSSIILNCTSGVASVIQHKNNSTYKGSSVSTCQDCCSVLIIPKDIIAGIRNSIRLFSPAVYIMTDKLNDIHPFSVLAYMSIKFLLEHALDGAISAGVGLFSTMALIQSGGTMYRNNVVDEKEWHKTMDTLTFTRPGYLQGKKIYNIPNKKGGYDYLEVKINNDLSLDRNNAIYISGGKTRILTKKETYQYFCEDYWTPFSMPTKYWDDSWKG